MANDRGITGRFIGHITSDGTPFVLGRRSPTPRWEDEALHRAMYARAPGLYALSALHQRARENQRKKILFSLLGSSRQGLDRDTVRVHERVIPLLLATLPADDVIEVFLSLRRARANHRYAARAMVRYILDHPCAADMAAKRRKALADILEHALGKSTARECARIIAGKRTDEAYLARHLLRHASSPGDARALFAGIFRQGEAPARTAAPYGECRLAPRPAAEFRNIPKTITAMNRGDIAATLVHIYRGGPNARLLEALDRYVEDEAAALPRFDGKVAMVLDASASTRGFGEREYSVISQSVALCLVMKKCAPSMEVHLAGGQGDPPFSAGTTDLALPLLTALEKGPDLAVVVSDGYENSLAGDLRKTLTALELAGIATPVAFCHSKFTARDDLNLRRPADAVTQFEFWHQCEFAELISSIFAMAGGPEGEAYLARAMERNLDTLEKEAASWMRSYK